MCLSFAGQHDNLFVLGKPLKFLLSETYRLLPEKDATRNTQHSRRNTLHSRTKNRNLVQFDKNCFDTFNIKTDDYFIYLWNLHYCTVQRDFTSQSRYELCFPHCRRLSQKSLVNIDTEAYSPTDRHTPNFEVHFDGLNHDSWMELVVEVPILNSRRNNTDAQEQTKEIPMSSSLRRISMISLMKWRNSTDDFLWFEAADPQSSMSFNVSVESLTTVFTRKAKCLPWKVSTIADTCWLGSKFIHSTAWQGSTAISPKEPTKCFYLPGRLFNASISINQTGK